ncbi:hypothetical protein [Hydrogenimonas sp.]
MTKSMYLYGLELFGDDETVKRYFERKKAAAKRLLDELQAVPMKDRDTLRINRVVKAVAWCQERIAEIEDAGRHGRSSRTGDNSQS